ncbi:hypothetical protein B9Z55_007435 [Caenorhabditis nigoni]|uniref:Uncharacterized protein n=1 Tax=Caenorhabditis nigoni TaxID=1611254 RepID=A0A2G5V9R0_9PELO|nr:hypothetical protein B9Z55_007435 [Caenorhabditis nigoni]
MQFSKVVFFFFLSVFVSSFGVNAFSLESKASHLKAIGHDFEELEEKESKIYAEIYKEIYVLKQYERKLRARRGVCGSKVLEKVIQICGDFREFQRHLSFLNRNLFQVLTQS